MMRHPADSRHSARPGTTLTEVLLSMMILSIGVLSLASLFPIGILSSIRATQLTNAVTLKQNAEAQIRIDPGLVLDPDQNHSPMYGTKSNYIIDPLVFIPLHPNAAVPPTIKVFDEDTNNNFRIDQGEDVNGNGKLDSLYRWHSGYTTRARAETLATLPDSWTELTASTPKRFLSPTRVELAGPVDLTAAAEIDPTTRMRVLLLDPTNARSHSADVLAYVDLNRNGKKDPGEEKITAQNGQFFFSNLRPLSEDINGNGVLDGPDGVVVPYSFEDTNRNGQKDRGEDRGEDLNLNGRIDMISPVQAITDVRLQFQDIKYSYLLTVRRQLDEDINGNLVLDPFEDINGNGFLDRGNGSASVDVVVYHRRDFNIETELPLRSPSGFVKDQNSVEVTIPSGFKYKSGGYLLDATNLRWYRIESSTVTSSTNAGANVLFTLQQPIIEDAPPSLYGVILTSHVVQVFQLGGI